MDMTFEDGIRRLEEIRQALDQEQIALADMVGLYKEGMELSKKLASMLDMTEKQIIQLEGAEENDEC